MRGTSSIAKPVIWRSRSARTMSSCACACMKPITTAPGLSAWICAMLSGCTVSSTSAAASTASALSAHSTLL